MGKAGLIGKKIAATFSSLGISSFFMHPAEASHGDLGMMRKKDLAILMSNSGQSPEIVSLLPSIKSIGATLISITGRVESALGQQGDILINIGELEEVDHLGLAPTTSTTAMLVIGDALAIASVKQNPSWSERDFAFFHPGGSLGKKLLQVHKLMKPKEGCVLVAPKTLVKTVLMQVSMANMGCALVVNDVDQILGMFSDGDLRRHLENDNQLLNKNG